jgi:hypothetical protein
MQTNPIEKTKASNTKYTSILSCLVSKTDPTKMTIHLEIIFRFEKFPRTMEMADLALSSRNPL